MRHLHRQQAHWAWMAKTEEKGMWVQALGSVVAVPACQLDYICPSSCAHLWESLLDWTI